MLGRCLREGSGRAAAPLRVSAVRFAASTSKRPLRSAPKKPTIKSTTSAESKKEENQKGSGSPFENSLTFQLFLIVGAMGAGYSLGKSMVQEKTPADLFPAGSTTTIKDLEDSSSAKKYGDYDKFRRCILRILQGQGYDIDVKNNKNEALLDDPFLSKDVAQTMIDADQVKDVFFGKKVDEEDPKSWVFYPKDTAQVAAILQTCQEFRIPVFTDPANYYKASDVDYKFVLDLSRLDEQQIGSRSVLVGPATDCATLYASLREKNLAINGKESALDILLSGLGIRLNDSGNRLLCGKYPRDHVLKVTGVLPDGTVVHASNDPHNAEEYRLFQLLADFDCGVITQAELAVHPTDSKDPHVISVLGFDSLTDVNSTVKKVTEKYPAAKVTLVDGTGVKPLKDILGCDTVALLKLRRSEAARLPDKSKLLTTIDPMAFPPSSAPTQLYYSSKIKNESSASVLILSDDLMRSDLVSYQPGTGIEEAKQAQEDTPELALSRKVRLALDPAQTLNPNVSIQTRVST